MYLHVRILLLSISTYIALHATLPHLRVYHGQNEHLHSNPHMDLNRLLHNFDKGTYSEFVDANQQHRTIDPAAAAAAASVGPSVRNDFACSKVIREYVQGWG